MTIELGEYDHDGCTGRNVPSIWDMAVQKKTRSVQSVYCNTVMRQAAALFMRPDPWPVAGRP